MPLPVIPALIGTARLAATGAGRKIIAKGAKKIAKKVGTALKRKPKSKPTKRARQTEGPAKGRPLSKTEKKVKATDAKRTAERKKARNKKRVKSAAVLAGTTVAIEGVSRLAKGNNKKIGEGTVLKDKASEAAALLKAASKVMNEIQVKPKTEIQVKPKTRTAMKDKIRGSARIGFKTRAKGTNIGDYKRKIIK